MATEDHATLPEGKYLAIQGTSVGLAPHTEDVVIPDRAFYEKIHTGFINNLRVLLRHLHVIPQFVGNDALIQQHF